MSSEDFWNSNPQLFFMYLDLYEENIKERREEQDYLCWLQGRYMVDAINQCLQTKHSIIYPKKPYSTLQEYKNKSLKEKALNWIRQVNSKILEE